MGVRACVRVRMRTRAHAYACACIRVRMHTRTSVRVCIQHRRAWPADVPISSAILVMTGSLSIPNAPEANGAWASKTIECSRQSSPISEGWQYLLLPSMINNKRSNVGIVAHTPRIKTRRRCVVGACARTIPVAESMLLCDLRSLGHMNDATQTDGWVDGQRLFGRRP